MLEFDLLTNYNGEGISEGLERGILVFFDGKNLVQEGMGLGTVALRTRNLTDNQARKHHSFSVGMNCVVCI